MDLLPSVRHSLSLPLSTLWRKRWLLIAVGSHLIVHVENEKRSDLCPFSLLHQSSVDCDTGHLLCPPLDQLWKAQLCGSSDIKQAWWVTVPSVMQDGEGKFSNGNKVS